MNADSGQPADASTAEEHAAALLEAHDPGSIDMAAFLGAQFDAGLAWVDQPSEFGGRNWPAGLQATVDRVLGSADAPRSWDANPLGFGMAAPTIIEHASPMLKKQLLRPLFTGEEVWCQLFSEPAAGSDLAGLETRAERDGDEWVVTGQKVWSSLAHFSSRGMLLARTDPSVAKHAGLTYFALDMASPGVDVRPLRQLTGDAEFNEVFLEEVRVPDSDRIGAVGNGWGVAMTTLANERSVLGGGMEGSRPIEDAVSLWRDAGSPSSSRDRLVRLWIRSETLRLVNERMAERAQSGAAGPEASIGRLLYGKLSQDINEFCVDVTGPRAFLYDSYQLTGRTVLDSDRTAYRFLHAMCDTIAGGTTEVQLNVIGEQVLGLPRESRPDKGRPWSEVRNR